MEEVFYLPRVGKNYFNSGFKGLKLLVLGESHYCKEKPVCIQCGIQSKRQDCFNFTKRVIEDVYFEYKRGNEKFEGWMNTFTKFTNVMLERQADTNEIIDFWESVVFYNFVQTSTSGSRESPTKVQFEESEDAFIQVLGKYKPDLIIVWGQRLWDRLDFGRWGEEFFIETTKHMIYYFQSGEFQIPAIQVYHPSTWRFNKDAYKVIEEVIKRIRTE